MTVRTIAFSPQRHIYSIQLRSIIRLFSRGQTFSYTPPEQASNCKFCIFTGRSKIFLNFRVYSFKSAHSAGPMKYHIMQHVIRVLTVCQDSCLQASIVKRGQTRAFSATYTNVMMATKCGMDQLQAASPLLECNNYHVRKVQRLTYNYI